MILRNQLDRLPLAGDPLVACAVNPAGDHDNIRGAGYWALCNSRTARVRRDPVSAPDRERPHLKRIARCPGPLRGIRV